MAGHTALATRRKLRKRQQRVQSPFTQEKAKSVLREERPTLRGRSITGRQKRLLGFIAGGGKPTRLRKRP